MFAARHAQVCWNNRRLLAPCPSLQAPLLRGEPAVQARVFDLLYNLSVHGELLYDAAAEAVPEDAPALAEAGALWWRRGGHTGVCLQGAPACAACLHRV